MTVEPASPLPERLAGRETGRVSISRGPAHGLAFALPWALVFWVAVAVMVLAI